ncbi:uncharacterized protein TNCV_4992051 [Trichonephila clavipes]|nr:uncharacterized protein TNCV_4992051 [Trichonephila clavipes]
MVLPAGQGQVPHPTIVPECFTINQLWNDRCTWPWGHCLLSELREWSLQTGRHNRLKRPRTRDEKQNLASQRERNRMRLLNLAYDRLRELLPCRKPPEKKLPKIQTLRFAIAYIKDLNELLSCGRQVEYQPRAPAPNYYSWLRQMKENVQQPQFQDQNVNCIVMDHADWMWEGQQRFMM